MITEDECYDILGLSRAATEEEIVQARRRMARALHPDRGGSHVAMSRVNEAYQFLVRLRAGSMAQHAPTTPTRRPNASATARRGFRDVPSFAVQALPVEAFELLILAAATLGDIVDDDPPYFLEVFMPEPGPVWCRFEMLPDAGSTTVNLACDVETQYTVFSPEEIRDVWIEAINAVEI